MQKHPLTINPSLSSDWFIKWPSDREWQKSTMARPDGKGQGSVRRPELSSNFPDLNDIDPDS
jgi:hypothetical protein